MISFKHARLLAYGFLMGTAGVTFLGSRDMKKLYTEVTAAVKRGGDCVMKTVTTIRENCQDINADADEINRRRAEAARAKEIADAKEVLAEAEEEEKAKKAAEAADAAADADAQ